MQPARTTLKHRHHISLSPEASSTSVLCSVKRPLKRPHSTTSISSKRITLPTPDSSRRNHEESEAAVRDHLEGDDTDDSDIIIVEPRKASSRVRLIRIHGVCRNKALICSPCFYLCERRRTSSQLRPRERNLGKNPDAHSPPSLPGPR